MKKIFFGFALGAVLLALNFSAQAQQKKVPRIGFLNAVSPSAMAPRVEAFRQGLRELGYLEGQNIIIEYRYAEGNYDSLYDFARELVGLKVDLIVTGGIPPTRAAQQATKTIPIIMGNVGDPIAAGFVASLARPGGNITGLTQITSELEGKRLELLKEALPKVSRIAVFVDASLPAQQVADALKRLQKPARALDVEIHSVELRGPKPDFDGAFRAASTARVNALLVTPQPVLNLDRKRLVDLAAKNRLPAIYGASEFVDVGGLMSYAASYNDLWRRAATYVDKILKGAKPSDLPVERPMKFEFVMNLKAAKQIGLTIPPNVLARADRVVR
jgi:putative tryptophan/tyrosine transport system substrate-binding protein